MPSGRRTILPSIAMRHISRARGAHAGLSETPPATTIFPARGAHIFPHFGHCGVLALSPPAEETVMLLINSPNNLSSSPRTWGDDIPWSPWEIYRACPPPTSGRRVKYHVADNDVLCTSPRAGTALLLEKYPAYQGRHLPARGERTIGVVANRQLTQCAGRRACGIGFVVNIKVYSLRVGRQPADRLGQKTGITGHRCIKKRECSPA
jgi:hypothetical protein